ncbi:DUF998 domain-containing protein [Candidatus Bathyarchaeota archaeon]|nr:DUF998 domain-containing protein [Candidatus Bathyarchaeota archaeon]
MRNQNRVLQFSGLSGIAATVLGFSTVFLSIASSPWFSWKENALSDLGVGGSGLIFNTGLAASGLLLITFILGLLKLSGGCWAWRLGSYLFLADAISLIGVGIFNESFGRVHLYFSLAFFTLMPLSLIMLGLSLWSRGIKRLSLFTLFSALFTPIIWTMPWRGAAIPEALSTLATGIWIINISLRMLRSGIMDRPASCPSGRVWHP